MLYEWYYSWWIFPLLCIGLMMVCMLLTGLRGKCSGMMHSHMDEKVGDNHACYGKIHGMEFGRMKPEEKRK